VRIIDSSMIDADRARKLALSLPEAAEQDHHGRPSSVYRTMSAESAP
jgi:hypothetical protein